MRFEEFCQRFKELLFKAISKDEDFKDIYAEIGTDDFYKIYSDRKAYTKLIKEIMKCFYLESKVKYFSEYFDIDHTWWEVNPNGEVDKVKLYDWKLKAVVEHENDIHDWTYEIEKLDSIMAPLRVVIGYVDNNSRELEEDIINAQKSKMKNMDFMPGDYEFGVILMNQKYVADAEDPLGMKTYLL